MNKKRPLVAFLFFLAFAIGLERLYYRQNGGFSIEKITSSTLPKTDLVLEQFQIADSLLDQSFRLIGSGGTSFVFLGDDGSTVLKLFKHQHLVADSTFLHIRFPGSSDAWRVHMIAERERRHFHKRKEFFFNSCSLAEKELKRETGLIFLCLHPDLHFARTIKLVDAWGISHSFDLSRTEFALQKKAELLFPYLETLLEDKQKATKAIDSLLDLIRMRCEKGIGDRDPNLLINFGFIDGNAIEFDLGSYFVDPQLKSAFAISQEMFFSTYELRQWLQERSPDLLKYMLERIIYDLK